MFLKETFEPLIAPNVRTTFAPAFFEMYTVLLVKTVFVVLMKPDAY